MEGLGTSEATQLDYSKQILVSETKNCDTFGNFGRSMWRSSILGPPITLSLGYKFADSYKRGHYTLTNENL